MVAPKDGVELLGACRHGQLAAAQLAASLPVAARGISPRGSLRQLAGVAPSARAGAPDARPNGAAARPVLTVRLARAQWLLQGLRQGDAPPRRAERVPCRASTQAARRD